MEMKGRCVKKKKKLIYCLMKCNEMEAAASLPFRMSSLTRVTFLINFQPTSNTRRANSLFARVRSSMCFSSDGRAGLLDISAAIKSCTDIIPNLLSHSLFFRWRLRSEDIDVLVVTTEGISLGVAAHACQVCWCSTGEDGARH